MPIDDVIKYKVELDTDDVSGQIQQLQDKISSEAGAAAFAAAGAPVTPFNFSQPFTDPGFGGYAPINTGGGFQALDQVMSGTRFGYEKFSTGLINQGLLAGSPFLEMGDLRAPRNLDPNIGGMDVYGSIMRRANSISPLGAMMESTFGFDYDPRLPISEREYKNVFRGRADSEVTEEWIGRGLSTFGFGAAGAVIGSVVPGVGTLIGGFVGGLAGESLGKGLLPDYEQMELTRLRSNFMQNVSFRSAGGQLTGAGGLEVANRIGQWQDSGYARDAKLGTAEIDTLVRTFAGAGGFDTDMNVDDFKRTVDSLISNARNVMQTLHMSTQEAAQFMGQMSQMGITDQMSIGGLTNMLSNAPSTMGLTPSEAIQMGMRATNMVQGTAIDPGQAFTGVLGMANAAHFMQANGYVDPSLITNAGGIGGAATQMYQSAMNYAASPMGFASITAMISDPSMRGASQLTQIGAAANYLLQGGPGTYFDVLGSKSDVVSAMDPFELFMQEGAGYVREYGMFNLGRLSQTRLKGYMMSRGKSEFEASMMSASVFGGEELINDYVLSKTQDFISMSESAPSVGLFTRIGRNIGEGLSVAGAHVAATAINMGKISLHQGTGYGAGNLVEPKDIPVIAANIRKATGGVVSNIAGGLNNARDDWNTLYTGKHSFNYMGVTDDPSIKGNEQEIISEFLNSAEAEEYKYVGTGRSLGRMVGLATSLVNPTLGASILFSTEIASRAIEKNLDTSTIAGLDIIETRAQSAYTKLIETEYQTATLTREADRPILLKYLQALPSGGKATSEAEKGIVKLAGQDFLDDINNSLPLRSLKAVSNETNTILTGAAIEQVKLATGEDFSENTKAGQENLRALDLMIGAGVNAEGRTISLSPAGFVGITSGGLDKAFTEARGNERLRSELTRVSGGLVGQLEKTLTDTEASDEYKESVLKQLSPQTGALAEYATIKSEEHLKKLLNHVTGKGIRDNPLNIQQ